MINLYNQDCMEAMKEMADNQYDLAVVDPEYGIGESSADHESRNTPVVQKNGSHIRIKSKGYKKKDWDCSPPKDLYFSELFRVTKGQIIFGANYFSSLMEVCKPPRRHEYSYFLNKNPKGYIIWDKMNGTNDFSDCEVIFTSFDFDSFIVYYLWAGMMQGLTPSLFEKIAKRQIGNKKKNENRAHPAQKPVKIYEWLLMNYAKPGDEILDTHCGLMSIALACHNLGFDLDLFEIDKDFFEAGKKRYEQHIKQLNLFI